MALPQGQIIVDSTELDNGTWRRVCGQNIYSEARNGLEQTVFLFREFTVTGSTPTEMMTRWNQTVNDFSRRNAAITASVDDTSEEFLADLTAFNGVNFSNTCSVEMLDEYVQTANSLRCLFKAEAKRNLTPGTSEDDDGGQATFDGLVGRIASAKVYTAGRVEARSVNGRFMTTFVDGAAGTRTITAVSNVLGKARFTKTASGPVFAAGMRMRVFGTTNYNGWHRITAIDAVGNSIDTETDYISAESGLTATAEIGLVTTGQANYDAARADILDDFLGTGTAGVRSASTGLALVEESTSLTGNSDDELEFLMSSEWMPIALSNATAATNERKLEYTVSTSQPGTWDADPMAGERPTIVSAKGSLVGITDGTATMAHWLLVRPDIISEAKRQSGNSSLEITSQTVVFSANARECSFALEFNSAPVVFAFKKSKQYSETPQITIWRDGEYQYAQKPEGGPERSIVISVSRIGADLVSLRPDTPTDFGLVWLPGPMITEERKVTLPSGLVVWEQSLSQAFIPLRPKESGGITVASPSVSGPITPG